MKLSDMAMDLAASIWMQPCTRDELYERGVVKNISSYSFDILLDIAFKRKWIYQSGSILKTYKSAVDFLNKNDYELY